MTPRLSIIVASSNAVLSIRDCLNSLTRQADSTVELIVVDNSDDGSTKIIQRDFPQIRHLTLPHQVLINELWSAGILQSRGEIVALTTAHCIPAHDWILQIVRAHSVAAAGIGGAIDGEAGSNMVDWAVCFCRYSRFLPPLTNDEVDDIPADNAAYKRVPLFRHEALWRDGFWEPQLHRALAAEGQILQSTATMLVRHRHSYSFTGFMHQRFLHGEKYGQWRASTLSPAKRLLMIAASPLIPFVLLQRAARRVASKQRYLSRLLLTLPLLAAFFFAWGCGEAMGYAKGSAR